MEWREGRPSSSSSSSSSSSDRPPPQGRIERKAFFRPSPFVYFRPDAWNRGVHAGGVDDSIIGLLARFVFPAGKLLPKYKGLGEEWAFRMHTVTALHLQYGLLSMWCTVCRQISPAWHMTCVEPSHPYHKNSRLSRFMFSFKKLKLIKIKKNILKIFFLRFVGSLRNHSCQSRELPRKPPPSLTSPPLGSRCGPYPFLGHTTFVRTCKGE